MKQSVSNSSVIFILGKARFQWLTSRLVRLEWCEDEFFEDRKTLAVVNRDFPAVSVTRKHDEGHVVLKSKDITLAYRDDGKPFHEGNLKIIFKISGKTRTWKPGQSNNGNLGATARTLDGVNGSKEKRAVPNPFYKKGAAGQEGKRYIFVPCELDLGKGLLSRDGWTVLDDSKNVVMEKKGGTEWVAPRAEGDRIDWYFFGYGHDYEAALRDGSELLGRQPMPPRYAFGYWWSRWWAYTDRELEGLVESFDTMKVPIDVLVVDMDWHLPGWTGYTWDQNYFPDPDQFLALLKEKGLKISLNLHPADGVGKHEAQFHAMARAMGLDSKKADKVKFDITDPEYMKHYFEILHHPEEKRGIDFWWMDWQQGASTAMRGLDTLPWINHLHWHDMLRNKDRRNKRPLIFSRYGGPGAGRYCIGFSGDTHSSWESLRYQPYFTATASNILYGFWSHDIGGFGPGEVEPELYTRWMQWGLYSPILRTHTTKNSKAERRAWEYPAPYDSIMMDVIRRRYELVPYVYTECRRTHETGVSLCRPMYYKYPEQSQAYAARDQYMFGSQLLVAPVLDKANPKTDLATVKVWLPEGTWYDTARGCTEKGARWIKRDYLLQEVPVFVRPGTIVPGQLGATRLNTKSIENLLLTIYPGKTGEYNLYEDDGITTDYERNTSASIRIHHQTRGRRKTITIDSARGSYPGFRATKNLEIRLPGSVPPKAVRCGGKSLPWSYKQTAGTWRYDGYTAAICISLDAVDLRKGLTLTIDEGNEKPADGLPGILARLELLRDLGTLVSGGKTPHPDERIGVELAQAGNRISRKPETYGAEWARLRRRIHDAPAMFLAVKKASTLEPQGEWRSAACDKALAVLKSVFSTGWMPSKA